MPGLAIRGPAAEEAVSRFERYERRVYNVCYRVLGYEEGAGRAAREALLDMLRGADPFAAAHSACLRRIEGPSVLREARRPGIRVANLTLSVGEREALALRELEGLSHNDIAEVMETDGEVVAELICDAWIGLRDSLSRPGPSTFRRAECERAQPLIALEEDGGLDPDSNEAGWLGEHLMRCRTCRLGRDAMQEAAQTYRAWRPMAPGPKLFRETMESAAELAGADWSRAIARHEAQRAAVLSHRLGDLKAIGVLGCLVVLGALAGVILERDRGSAGPLRGTGAPAAEREPPASATPTAPGAAAEEPASQPRASRGSGSPGPASATAPKPRGKAGRTAAKKEGGPEPSRPRRSETRLERRRPDRSRAERRRPERERRPSAAPDPAPQRPQSRPQAQIERQPDSGGQEAILPELAPAPAPPAAQP